MMNISDEQNFAPYFIISAVLVIIGLVLWNTSLFLQRLKQEETDKMEIWAQSYLALNSNSEDQYLELSNLIHQTNYTIPIIITDENDQFLRDKSGHLNLSNSYINLPENMSVSALRARLEEIKAENPPIIMDLAGTPQYIYFGNSAILKKLKYYPITIALIILLLIGVIYFFFSTSKISEQNKLWAGMAKETAHQIGTPLSSLIGWLELLKTEQVNPDYLVEIQKDISRLQMITDRFSKIGSKPKLESLDIVKQTKTAFQYLETRSSKLIHFSLSLPNYPIWLRINAQLYGWTIENLVKNAIDAMRGKGELQIKLTDEEQRVLIQITDTGKGIAKSKFSKIFEPGHTSKSRGWGLGLSLAKRIIEEYHSGKIKVLRSEIGKGTTFQIVLKK